MVKKVNMANSEQFRPTENGNNGFTLFATIAHLARVEDPEFYKSLGFIDTNRLAQSAGNIDNGSVEDLNKARSLISWVARRYGLETQPIKEPKDNLK